MNDTINNKSIDNGKYRERYMVLKKMLLLHASDDVILLFTKFNMDTEKNDSVLTLRNLFELMVLIRKELGYKGGKIDEKVILNMIVGKENEYKEFCNILGY